MKLGGIVLAILLAIGSITPLDARGAPHGQDQSRGERLQGEQTVIKDLQLALAHTGKTARIYFHAACYQGDDSRVLFPVIDVQPLQSGESGLEAVQKIFRNDKDVRVTETRSGIVTIVIGKVSGAILSTKLPLLKLSRSARYNPGGPGGAIDTIESAAVVKAAAHKLGIQQEPYFYIGLVEPLMKTLPHLLPEMRNVTVDQALDTIARTFPGVVVYGECTRPDGGVLIDINFDWFKTGD